MRRRTHFGSAVRRERRQREAIERQARYDALSLEGKLALLTSRPGRSFREHSRLTNEFHEFPLPE